MRPWLWLAVLAALGCAQPAPPGRCGRGQPVPSATATLACGAPQQPALAYVEGGLLSLFLGRESKVVLDAEATRVSVLSGADEHPLGPFAAVDSPHQLGLFGGPCTSGCEVSASTSLWGPPVEPLHVRFPEGTSPPETTLDEIGVFGGVSRVCVESGGVMTIPPGALMLQFNGRSPAPELANKAVWMGFRNPEPARLRVDFDARRLELDAELCEEDGRPWGLTVSARGAITNVPPVAVTPGRLEVECTSPAGASVTLDATASFDLDGDPLSFAWWKGGVGWDNELVRGASGDPKATVLAPPGTTTYWVNVQQDLFTGSQAPLEVVVQRTTACARPPLKD